MRPIRLLLQTTIPRTDDDWHVGRFSILRDHLTRWRSPEGEPVCEVTARDRAGADDDPVLSHLGDRAFDELWLFAVDTGQGLTPREQKALFEFHARGGGILTARDHQDLGASLGGIPCLGALEHFHRLQPESEEARRQPDDGNPRISWPNYHSGWNGDLQPIVATIPPHPLLFRDGHSAAGGILSRFPAHPHEGAVEAPPGDPSARVVAEGRSTRTGRAFNLMVGVERTRGDDGRLHGRVVAHSSFHHFCDYNWDLRAGAPSFVDDPPGSQVAADHGALDDIKTYVRNAARWLAPAADRGAALDDGARLGS
jgi:hypothetical protein